MLQKCYQETIDSVVKAGYVREVQKIELNKIRDNLQWYLPHHPVINPHKPENVRRVSNEATKYQGIALNDKLLFRPDLLQSPIGNIFCVREHKTEISADIEATFLQVAVTGDDSDAYHFSSEKILSRG